MRKIMTIRLLWRLLVSSNLENLVLGASEGSHSHMHACDGRMQQEHDMVKSLTVF